MGTNLSMIVHICGMNVDNYRENMEQLDLINSIFTIQNNKKIHIIIRLELVKSQKGKLLFIDNKEIFHK